MSPSLRQAQGLRHGQLEGILEEDVPREPQRCRTSSSVYPGLPALIVFGTGTADSYGRYTIHDKRNVTTLEL